MSVVFRKVFLPKSFSTAFLAFLVGCVVRINLPPIISTPSQVSTRADVPFKVCFSPEGHCTALILSAINESHSSILVMAYSFTSPQIAYALGEAFARGVDVKILIDKSQVTVKYSQFKYLFQTGIPIFIDSVNGLAHNKVMIFDERRVLTGSFNFTRAAESKNAENILLIDDPTLAQIYKRNWEARVVKAKLIGL